MKRNTTTLFLESTNATTPVAWVNDEPDFSYFTEPTLGVLQRAWQNFLDSGQDLEIIPDPEPVVEPPQSDWDSFNGQMLSDPEFNQVYNTANLIAPVVCASLPAALTQVSNGQTSMFRAIWTSIMGLGGSTQEQRDKWGQWAENATLPTEFVNIIKGLSS